MFRHRESAQRLCRTNMETKSHTDPEGPNWKDCRVKISGRSGSVPTSTRESSESGTLSVGEEVVSRGGGERWFKPARTGRAQGLRGGGRFCSLLRRSESGFCNNSPGICPPDSVTLASASAQQTGRATPHLTRRGARSHGRPEHVLTS